jgi:hypothetical protein
MNFRGHTIAEAATNLSSFVERTAQRLGIPLMGCDLEEPPVAVLDRFCREADSASGGSFRIEFEVQPQQLADQIAQYPTTIDPGSGEITKRGGRVPIELRLDERQMYCWYCVPNEISAAVEKIVPTDGAPFQLSEDYVADGLRALL